MTNNTQLAYADDRLTIEEADEIAMELTDGGLHVEWGGGGILLCGPADAKGVFLAPWQMTRLGVVSAIVDLYQPSGDVSR